MHEKYVISHHIHNHEGKYLKPKVIGIIKIAELCLSPAFSKSKMGHKAYSKSLAHKKNT